MDSTPISSPVISGSSRRRYSSAPGCQGTSACCRTIPASSVGCMASATRLAIMRSSSLTTVAGSVRRLVIRRIRHPSVLRAWGGTGGLAWYAKAGIVASTMCSLRIPSGRAGKVTSRRRRQPEGIAEGERDQAITELDDQATDQLGRGHRGDQDRIGQAPAIGLALDLLQGHLERLIVPGREPGEREDLLAQPVHPPAPTAAQVDRPPAQIPEVFRDGGVILLLDQEMDGPDRQDGRLPDVVIGIHVESALDDGEVELARIDPAQHVQDPCRDHRLDVQAVAAMGIVGETQQELMDRALGIPGGDRQKDGMGHVDEPDDDHRQHQERREGQPAQQPAPISPLEQLLVIPDPRLPHRSCLRSGRSTRPGPIAGPPSRIGQLGDVGHATPGLPLRNVSGKPAASDDRGEGAK